MLLIRCPYCETDRPEIEFKNGGQAHLTRPDPNAATDEEWT
ncbi:MAG: sarcosine oxidase subunit delta, partial [Hyphomicrobiales bacterium]|nr:sarcosine oxidase subunit delta [Hyphomicrobiales bacterium]